MTQTGFLYADSDYGMINIINVTFEDNVVMVGAAKTTEEKEQGSLIFINKIELLFISTCTFKTNLGTQAGTIRILPYLDTDGISSIVITDNSFTNNGSLSKGGAIGIEFRRQLYDITLSRNVFKYNSSHTDDAVV